METKDFERWLGNLVVRDIGQIYCLYESIRTETINGAYRIIRDSDKLFVHTENNPEVLLLATNLAEKAFVDKLDNDFRGDFGDVRERYQAMVEAEAILNRLRNID